MARGFGTTDGVATDDRILSALTTTATLRSYGGWIWITGPGGGGNGRVFGKDPAVLVEDFVYNDVNGTLSLFRSWGVLAQWHMTAPSTGVWHHVLVVYDGSSTANVPVMYLDGTSVSVTTDTAPSGSLLMGSTPMALGNRPTAWTRNWNGRLAEFAMWDRLLTAQEAANLGSGAVPYAPALIDQSNFVEYIPMISDAFGLAGTTTITGTTVKASPPITYQFPFLSPLQVGPILAM